MVISGGCSAVYPSMGNAITGQVSQLENIENGWTSVNALNVPRFAHGCGVVNQGGNEKIVIAGGVGSELLELDSVEIYAVGVFSSQSWTMGGCCCKMLLQQLVPSINLKVSNMFAGTPLPMAMRKASSFQVDGSFVLVGGHSDAVGDQLDTVLAYHPDEDRWEELQSMRHKRASATAMLISMDVFLEC